MTGAPVIWTSDEAAHDTAGQSRARRWHEAGLQRDMRAGLEIGRAIGGQPDAIGHGSRVEIFGGGQPHGEPRAGAAEIDLLDEAGRRDIVAFYGDLLGAAEHAEMTVDRARLVLGLPTHEQFFFIVGNDEPMRAPVGAPVGVSVSTLADFAQVARRAAASIRSIRVTSTTNGVTRAGSSATSGSRLHALRAAA